MSRTNNSITIFVRKFVERASNCYMQEIQQQHKKGNFDTIEYKETFGVAFCTKVDETNKQTKYVNEEL